MLISDASAVSRSAEKYWTLEHYSEIQSVGQFNQPLRARRTCIQSDTVKKRLISYSIISSYRKSDDLKSHNVIRTNLFHRWSHSGIGNLSRQLHQGFIMCSCEDLYLSPLADANLILMTIQHIQDWQLNKTYIRTSPVYQDADSDIITYGQTYHYRGSCLLPIGFTLRHWNINIKFTVGMVGRVKTGLDQGISSQNGSLVCGATGWSTDCSVTIHNNKASIDILYQVNETLEPSRSFIYAIFQYSPTQLHPPHQERQQPPNEREEGETYYVNQTNKRNRIGRWIDRSTEAIRIEWVEE